MLVVDFYSMLPKFIQANLKEGITMHIVWSMDIRRSCSGPCLRIPMIYAIDAIHGNINVYSDTIFLHNIGLEATRLVPYKISMVVDG